MPSGTLPHQLSTVARSLLRRTDLSCPNVALRTSRPTSARRAIAGLSCTALTLEDMAQDFGPTLVIGTRVVVRYRLEAEDHGDFGEQFSDALGYVRSVNGSHVEVETRGGTVVIERTAITHAKSVPPAPPRRKPR